MVIRNSCLRNRGSLLLEFLIALTIFAFCIAGLAVLQNRATAMIGDVSGEGFATFIAEDVYGRIEMNLPFASEYNKAVLGENTAPKKSNKYVTEDLKQLTTNAKTANVLINITTKKEGSEGQAKQGFSVTVEIQSLAKDDPPLFKETRFIQFIPSHGRTFNSI